MFKKIISLLIIATIICGCNHIGIRHWKEVPKMIVDKHKTKKEIKTYNRIINSDPTNANNYAERGKLKYKIGDYNEAINDLNNAIKIQPNNANYYLLRGNIKKRKNEKANAIDDYNKAIATDPNLGDAYFSRGEIKQFTNKDTIGALEDYSKAIELGNAEPCVYYYRAEIYLEIKENLKACNDFQEAINKGCSWTETIKQQMKNCQ